MTIPVHIRTTRGCSCSPAIVVMMTVLDQLDIQVTLSCSPLHAFYHQKQPAMISVGYKAKPNHPMFDRLDSHTLHCFLHWRTHGSITICCLRNCWSASPYPTMTLSTHCVDGRIIHPCATRKHGVNLYKTALMGTEVIFPSCMEVQSLFESQSQWQSQGDHVESKWRSAPTTIVAVGLCAISH